MSKSSTTTSCGHADHDHCGVVAPHRSANDVIRVEHVSFSYRGRGAPAGKSTRVLEDVSLNVESGMNLGIIGPNGAGKTTLLRIMLGLLDGYNGIVTVAGLSPTQACRRGDIVGYVPQRPSAEWRFPLTAGQVIRLGLVGKTGLFRRYAPADLEYARQMMERTGVAHLAEAPIGELSGGQQQRIFIARALVARPRIVILDEPMSGIDVAGQREIGALIRDLHQSLKLTVIVVSHDIEALAAGCTRIACLRRSIHYHDAPQGLTPQVLRAVFQHGYDAVLGSEAAQGSTRVQGSARVQGSGFRVQEGSADAETNGAVNPGPASADLAKNSDRSPNPQASPLNKDVSPLNPDTLNPDTLNPEP